MRRKWKYWVSIILGVMLQSCAVAAVYGTLQAINNVNNVLNMVCKSMNTIQTVLNEGTDIKRAAEEGRLISTLADSIPRLVVNHFEKSVEEKINMFSGDLKTTAVELTKHALAENLTEARQTYNTMTDTYNRFANLMVDLEQTAK